MTHIYLGKNVLTGKKLFLSITDLATTHAHILGRSGVGKSKLLERVARDIIKAGYGLIVLDGKGDLYDNLLNFCAYMEVPARKVRLIDPRDDHTPGLNVLERLGKTDPATQANLVIEAIQKMHGEDETRHWLEEWGRAILSPLCLANFTLTEVFAFARTDDPNFRRAILNQINDPYLMAKWREFESYKPAMQAEMVRVVKTRVDLFQQSPFLCAMFGQLKTTIDWLDLMDSGKIFLSQLAYGAIDQKQLSFIGVSIINQIMRLAYSRPKDRRRPCFVIIDEFQNFLTPDIASALDTLRGFGVYFILAHQNLEQLKQDDPKIYHSVMGNARIKVAFTVSREDCEIMYGEIFPDKVYAGMQQIKDEIYQTKFRPIETWRDIYTESDTDSESVLTISSDNEPRPTTTTAHTASHTQTPGVIHEEFKEITGRTYHSEVEVKERLISWIHTQNDRHYQLKIKHLPAIPMVSPTVQDVEVYPPKLDRYKQNIYALNSRPIDEVRKEVDQRVANYLINYHKSDEPETSQPKRKR